MEKMGMGFWLSMAVLAVLTACCAYLALLGVQADDRSGPWLFAAFGFLFAIPLLLGLFRLASMRNPKLKYFYDKTTGTDYPQATRFVPHWFMMAAIIVLGLILLYWLITGILSFLK